jgi:hypothetical protein
MNLTNAARFAAALATLHAAHDVGDHIAQTHHQAAAKTAASGWVRPMVGHVAGYHAVQLAAVLTVDRLLGLGLRPGRVAAAVVWSAGTHAFLDRRWPVRWVLRRTGAAEFAEMTTPVNGMYVADQALHHAVLWVAALLVATGTENV